MLTEDQAEPEAVEPEVRPGRLGIILVAIIAVAMFGAATTLGVLYMNEKKARTELTEKVEYEAAKLSAANDREKSQAKRLENCRELLNLLGSGTVVVEPPPENTYLHC